MDFIENLHLILFLLSLIGIFIGFLIERKHQKGKNIYSPYAILVLTLIINTALIHYNSNLQGIYGIVSQSFSTLFVVFLIILFYWYYVLGKDAGDVFFVIPFSPIIILIVTMVLFFSTYTVQGNDAVEKINLERLENSIYKVQDNFVSMKELIENESQSIEDVFQEIRTEFENKNNELKNTIKREKELIAQIEHYKTLTSLSKEQVEAVNQSLKQSKNSDLILSFVIGFLSSLMVWIVSQTKYFLNLFKRE